MDRIRREWQRLARRPTAAEQITFRALTSWGTFLLLQLAIFVLALSR